MNQKLFFKIIFLVKWIEISVKCFCKVILEKLLKK